MLTFSSLKPLSLLPGAVPAKQVGLGHKRQVIALLMSAQVGLLGGDESFALVKYLETKRMGLLDGDESFVPVKYPETKCIGLLDH
jgi:hypothetical protein